MLLVLNGLPARSCHVVITAAQNEPQINPLRSICGRGVARSAVGQLQAHTFPPEQHHKSDNGQQAPVLGLFFSSGDNAPKAMYRNGQS
jgi:hypothetical protein